MVLMVKMSPESKLRGVEKVKGKFWLIWLDGLSLLLRPPPTLILTKSPSWCSFFVLHSVSVSTNGHLHCVLKAVPNSTCKRTFLDSRVSRFFCNLPWGFTMGSAPDFINLSFPLKLQGAPRIYFRGLNTSGVLISADVPKRDDEIIMCIILQELIQVKSNCTHKFKKRKSRYGQVKPSSCS